MLVILQNLNIQTSTSKMSFSGFARPLPFTMMCQKSPVRQVRVRKDILRAVLNI